MVTILRACGFFCLMCAVILGIAGDYFDGAILAFIAVLFFGGIEDA